MLHEIDTHTHAYECTHTDAPSPPTRTHVLSCLLCLFECYVRALSPFSHPREHVHFPCFFLPPSQIPVPPPA
jgi:hypothetical protein